MRYNVKWTIFGVLLLAFSVSAQPDVQLYGIFETWQNEYEFVTLSAIYLLNFRYLSKPWTITNLPKIFDSGNHLRWSCAIQGYAYVGRVYKEFYEFLRNEGHFLKALQDQNLSDQVKENIIQNIGIAYKNGIESLDDENSLVVYLLNKGSLNQLGELIWFFWTLRGQQTKEIRQKVQELWPRILNRLDTNTKEGKKLASRLSTWVVFMEEIDEEHREFLFKTIPFAEVDYKGPKILEEIARISQKQPIEAGELWNTMFEISAPDFPKEAVFRIFANLAANGEEGKRLARDIASQYISQGTERPGEWLNQILSGENSE